MARGLALPLVLLVVASSLPAQSGKSAYVIRDVRVFDGETVAERRTVLISDGRIAAIGDAMAVPQCTW